MNDIDKGDLVRFDEGCPTLWGTHGIVVDPQVTYKSSQRTPDSPTWADVYEEMPCSRILCGGTGRIEQVFHDEFVVVQKEYETEWKSS